MAKRYPPADQVELGHYELSTHLLALECMARGLTVTWLNRSFFVVPVNGRNLGFWCTRSNGSSSVASKVAVRKDLTKRLLRTADVAVARGRWYAASRGPERAAAYAKRLGYPVVVKPSDGDSGKGVTVGVRGHAAFHQAWEVATARRTRGVIVEQFFEGTDCRFLVVGEECVAVAERVPPKVVGNGRDTVEALIEAQNEVRRGNIYTRRRPIEIDEHRRERIRRTGFELDEVPPAGTTISIDDKASVSRGASSIDRTDDVHPSYLEVAARAVRSFPGLAIAGVDMLGQDFTRPARSDNYIVCEVNSMPVLALHHFPVEGAPRDVTRAVVDFHLRWLARGDGDAGWMLAAQPRSEPPGRATRVRRAVRQRARELIGPAWRRVWG